VLTGRTGGNLTVKELVSLGRHPHTHWSGKLNSEDIQKIEDAIEKTHMELLQNRKLYTLSDGQLQKAMIARALAQDSAIMILDEPTAHLDLNNRMEIMDLLHKMAKETNKDRKSTRLNSSHVKISYAVFCLKKKKTKIYTLQ